MYKICNNQPQFGKYRSCQAKIGLFVVFINCNSLQLKHEKRYQRLFSRLSFSVDSTILFASGWSSGYDDRKNIIQLWRISNGKLITTLLAD
jgi:hypothetical protein